ncbi:MAG: HNH endonuclease [Thiotrichales bacterium]
MSQKNNAIQVADRRGFYCDEAGNIYTQHHNKLKLYDLGNGYLAFSIRIHTRVIKVPVHRFIAYQRFGESALFDQLVVRHLDGDKHNNTWGNLALGTHRENALDRPKIARIEHASHAQKFRWVSAS